MRPSSSSLTESFPHSFPDNLSELLAIVVKDARSLKRADYLPWWAAGWHVRAHNNSICMINDAGAVIAGTLGYGSKSSPLLFQPPVMRRLQAICFASQGEYDKALAELGWVIDEVGLSHVAQVSVSPYCHYGDWTNFIKHVDWLEKVVIPELKEIGV